MKTKNLINLFLILAMAVVMLLSFNVTVFAETGTGTVGSYTVALPNGVSLPSGVGIGTTVTPITSTTTSLGSGWYVVNDDVVINDSLELLGVANIILCDGKHLTVNQDMCDQYGEYPFTIYGGPLGTGTLTVNWGISGDFILNGGIVTAMAEGCSGGYTYAVDDSTDPIIINGGVLNAIAVGPGSIGFGCGGNAQINGGILNAQGEYAGIKFNEDAWINGGKVYATGGLFGISVDRYEQYYEVLTITGGEIVASGSTKALDGYTQSFSINSALNVEAGADAASAEITSYSDQKYVNIYETPVCTVGSKDNITIENRYPSVTAALDAIPGAEQTAIYLIDDDTEDITIPAWYNVLLDINGHTLTGKGSNSVITNNGTLTLTDSAADPGNVTGGTKGVEQNGNLTLAGKVHVSGNTKNLYLPDGKTFSIQTGFDGSAGVSTETAPTTAVSVVLTGASNTNYSDYFTSDNSDYAVANIGSGDNQILKLVKHNHNWQYAAGETADTIVATCDGDGPCPCNNTASITLVKPTRTVYGDGSTSAEATISGSIDGVVNPAIQYYKDEVPLAEAPTDAGSYTAKITLGTVTASVDYTIAKRVWGSEKPGITVRSIPIGNYKEANNTPTNSANVVQGVQYYYNLTNSNTGGTTWTKANLDTLASGTYYVYAVFEASDNMEGCTTAAWPFTVHHVHSYQYTTDSKQPNKIFVKCVAEEATCSDARELVLKIDNAVYTGKPYVPAGVTKFEEEADVSVVITYKDSNHEVMASAPVDAGTYSATIAVGGAEATATFQILQSGITKPTVSTQTVTFNGKKQSYSITPKTGWAVKNTSGFGTVAGDYDVIIALTDPANTCWAGDNEAGTDDLVFEGAFVIKKKKVAVPVDPADVVYSGYEQTLLAANSDYTLTNHQQTNVGTYEITATLVDTENCIWNDETTSPQAISAKITPYAIPIPVADPRLFRANGNEQQYYALYLIGNYYYNFNGEFYTTTNDRRTDVGSQTVYVTPTANFCWGDGSTTAKEYTFTIDVNKMNARVYYLYDKQNSRLTDGYTYGYYQRDDKHPENVYVKTFFNPTIYNIPQGATYTFYVCTDPKNRNDAIKWDDLYFLSLPITNSTPGSYATYYVYAKVKCEGYEDYTTPCCAFHVYAPSTCCYTNQAYTYQEEVYHSGRSLLSCFKTKETRTGLTTVKVQAFLDPRECFRAMYATLNEGYHSVDYYLTTTWQSARFTQAKKQVVYNYAYPATGKVQNQKAYMLLCGLDVGSAEPVLDLITVEELNVVPENFILQGDNFDANTPNFDRISFDDSQMTAANNLLEEADSADPTVTFDLNHFEDGSQDNLILKTGQVTWGTKLTAPADPTRDGYTFKGWYYFDSDRMLSEETLTLENDGILWDFNDTVTNDLTLYAMWDEVKASSAARKYSITALDASNGGLSVSAETASVGKTVTITVTPDKGYTLETIAAVDKNDNEIELIAEKLGESYTFKMPSVNVTVKATFMEDNTMLNYFFDVTKQDYYYEAVLWAAENGITSGKIPNYFVPKDTCTRAEFMTLLWNAAGKPVVNYEMPFTDVADGQYYTEAIRWAASLGITKGTSATTFNPSGIINRAQVITYLARYAGIKDDASGYTCKFTDVALDAYYASAVAWAAEKGITSGKTETSFGPEDPCERAHVVVFLYNFFVK